MPNTKRAQRIDALVISYWQKTGNLHPKVSDLNRDQFRELMDAIPTESGFETLLKRLANRMP